jgi:hypothetical protein
VLGDCRRSGLGRRGRAWRRGGGPGPQAYGIGIEPEDDLRLALRDGVGEPVAERAAGPRRCARLVSVWGAEWLSR